MTGKLYICCSRATGVIAWLAIPNELLSICVSVLINLLPRVSLRSDASHHLGKENWARGEIRGMNLWHLRLCLPPLHHPSNKLRYRELYKQPYVFLFRHVVQTAGNGKDGEDSACDRVSLDLSVDGPKRHRLSPLSSQGCDFWAAIKTVDRYPSDP